MIWKWKKEKRVFLFVCAAMISERLMFTTVFVWKHQFKNIFQLVGVVDVLLDQKVICKVISQVFQQTTYVCSFTRVSFICYMFSQVNLHYSSSYTYIEVEIISILSPLGLGKLAYFTLMSWKWYNLCFVSRLFI